MNEEVSYNRPMGEGKVIKVPKEEVDITETETHVRIDFTEDATQELEDQSFEEAVEKLKQQLPETEEDGEE